MATDNNNKVLNVPNLRFPEFTEEWRKYKVSDVLDFYSTNSLSWEQLDYNNEDLYNLHYGLIHVGLPILVDIGQNKLPGIKTECKPKNFELCKEGDVAFADASEDTNDVAKAIEFVNLNNHKTVCGLHTIHGRDNKHLTVLGYKGYAFASPLFHNQIRRIAQGTKIYSISSKNFAECYIGIPSKDEQSKIARLLALIDSRIATQNKIIEDLKKLKVAITQKISKDNSNRKVMLSELLTERYEKNKDLYPVHSVSVSEGIINQVDFLGRSFAANDISNYNVVCCGDIVYTKSPTGDFPYGIVKMSSIDTKVSVSPLYGVYHPSSEYVGIYLNNYFSNSLNAKNYLHKLIQKGAKNTINITNKRFLENEISLPNETLLKEYSLFISAFDLKIKSEQKALLLLQKQKEYLLQQMFI